MLETQNYLDEVAQLLASEVDAGIITLIVDRLIELYWKGGTLFLIGNGGSAATVSHIAVDFVKCIYTQVGRFYGQPFRALALTDAVPVLTAWANDVDYQSVFVEQVRCLSRPGDMLLCVSGSGNSKNILKAARFAREHDVQVIGLTGYEGGKLDALCDVSLIIPSDDMQKIEDCHMVVCHLLFRRVMERLQEGEGAPEYQIVLIGGEEE